MSGVAKISNFHRNGFVVRIMHPVITLLFAIRYLEEERNLFKVRRLYSSDVPEQVVLQQVSQSSIIQVMKETILRLGSLRL